MTFPEFVSELLAKAEAALKALEGFNQAHPDIASAEADALKVGVADLAGAAKKAADVTPPPVEAVFDGLISDAEAAFNAQVESLTAAKDAKIKTLQEAKAAAAPTS